MRVESGRGWTIYQGDLADPSTLEHFGERSFDACLGDPPYGFSFMGKTWDYQVPTVEQWAGVLRVMKPGAALLSFGGSRTYHRVACNIEDAGFELRDQLLWLYAKGFPKSLNVSKELDRRAKATRPVIGQQTLTGNAAVSLKEKGGTYGVQVGTVPAKTIDITGPATELAQRWDGYGTALKPAFEPIALARRPLEGTVAENVTKWGCGALAINACRIGGGGGVRKQLAGYDKGDSVNAYGDGLNGGFGIAVEGLGRWPANLLLDEAAGAILDAEVGDRPSGKVVRRNGGGGKIFGFAKGEGMREDGGYSDSGGASRFFFSAKVSTKEREAGCEHLPLKSAGECTDREDGAAALECPRSGAGRGFGARNNHPTLKPIALTTYLARLILPPRGASPRRLIVPFSGAGSEMIGALLAGWDEVVGIEMDADSIQIAAARLRHWVDNRDPLFGRTGT